MGPRCAPVLNDFNLIIAGMKLNQSLRNSQ